VDSLPMAALSARHSYLITSCPLPEQDQFFKEFMCLVLDDGCVTGPV